MVIAVDHPPTLAQPVQTAQVGYGFAGAALGMGLEDWRHSDPVRANAPCAPDAGHASILICRAPDRRVGRNFVVNDVTYAFVDDRLARIAFRSSVDDFADTVALLRKRFGAPNTILHDQVQLQDGRKWEHVAMTWRNGRSQIQLSDPLAHGVTLSVRFTLNAAAKRLNGITG